MKFRKIKIAGLSALLLSAGALSLRAQVIISEVDPSGSGTVYNADWFELTNKGLSAVNITGWRMDDNSNSFGASVGLRGITSIAPGKSVIFLESTDSLPATDLAIQTSFKNTWFGSSAPAGLLLGNYNGSGVGMSQTGDAVNIFDSLGTLVTKVTFGAAFAVATFDNSAGLSNVTITTPSVVGINGAFLASNGEIGSPRCNSGALELCDDHRRDGPWFRPSSSPRPVELGLLILSLLVSLTHLWPWWTSAMVAEAETLPLFRLVE